MEFGVGAGKVTRMPVAERESGFFHRAARSAEQAEGFAHLHFEQGPAGRATSRLAEETLQAHGGNAEVIGQCGRRRTHVEVPAHPLLGQLQAVGIARTGLRRAAGAAGQIGIDEFFQGDENLRRQRIRPLDLAPGQSMQLLQFNGCLRVGPAQPAR